MKNMKNLTLISIILCVSLESLKSGVDYNQNQIAARANEKLGYVTEDATKTRTLVGIDEENKMKNNLNDYEKALKDHDKTDKNAEDFKKRQSFLNNAISFHSNLENLLSIHNDFITDLDIKDKLKVSIEETTSDLRQRFLELFKKQDQNVKSVEFALDTNIGDSSSPVTGVISRKGPHEEKSPNTDIQEEELNKRKTDRQKAANLAKEKFQAKKTAEATKEGKTLAEKKESDEKANAELILKTITDENLADEYETANKPNGANEPLKKLLEKRFFLTLSDANKTIFSKLSSDILKEKFMKKSQDKSFESPRLITSTVDLNGGAFRLKEIQEVEYTDLLTANQRSKLKTLSDDVRLDICKQSLEDIKKFCKKSDKERIQYIKNNY